MSSGFILLLVLMVAVVLVLFTGIGAMLKGGEFNQRYGNQLMQARVVLQGLALLVLAILLMTGGGHGN